MKMEDLVNFAKQYGFIFQGSEIYGGLANTWDYGPLGARLKNNVKDAWRKRFIQERPNAFELDADILMHPKVWEASGHVESFADPLTDCKHCKTRHRADNLVNDWTNSSIGDKMSDEELIKYIKDNNVPCPKCGKCDFTDIRQFKLMFETYRGVTKDSKSVVYLRPENAQGEYVNFLNVLRTTRSKIPFAIGQIGKAFRNEVTPGNFTFRTIEFEQMEFQNFCKPGDDLELYERYKKIAWDFYSRIGIDVNKLRYHDHEKLAFYAKAACDIEYKFPFGWGELNGTHDRTDYDLKKHQEYSGQSMIYTDPDTNEKYVPYIVESTVGLDRAVLCTLIDAFTEEKLEDGSTREILKLHPYLAPYKVAVLPLIKKNHSELANELFDMLSKKFSITYDESGNIGKRYRRQDATGTPFCVTIDDETIKNKTVTVRDRDTMKQDVVKIDKLVDYISKKIEF